MNLTGLLSITFRKLSPLEIVQLVKQGGLQAIEWGGDIHVPHGDVAKAKEVRVLTEDAGLLMPSYGSYYRVGGKKEGSVSFEAVLESASVLGTSAIRVWAGSCGSADADESIWQDVVDDARRIADLAEQAGIRIDYEFHANTLTDTLEATLRLLKEADHPNIRCNWQPPVPLDFNERLAGLKAIEPWLANIHVFHWQDRDRLPLEAGMDAWKAYYDVIEKVEGDHHMMLEFVQNDDPEQFLRDAEALKRIVNS